MAGLTLIGFLARRMPGEAPSPVGVAEVRAQATTVRFALRRVAKKRVAV